METAEKRKIYNILVKRFEFETPYLMALVGGYLSENHISCENFGYPKMRQLLEEMPECASLSQVRTGTNMNYTVTLHEWKEEAVQEEAERLPAPREGEKPEAEPLEKPLGESDKRAVYDLLIDEFPAETPLPMASISLVMTNEGYRKETYGFVKMKQLLRQLSEFMTLQDTVTNGVPATLVTLHRVPSWDHERGRNSTGCPEAFQQLPETMNEIILPNKTLAILNKLITGEEAAPSEEILNRMKESYREARANGTFTVRENAYTFPLSLKAVGGEPMIAGIKPSRFEGENGWFLNFIGVQHSTPGKAIENFAFMGFWDNVLSDLAEMALPEKWYFQGEDPNSKLMLRSYLQYTFYRLQLEDKVSVSDDGRFAAFNTGMVTPHYDDIYACFEPNDDRQKNRWRFIGFSKAGGRGLGKRLVNYFNPLPQPASYFERKEDLLFDLEKDLHTDYDHILLDNIARLPVEFLREELHSEPDALELLDEIEAERSPKAKKNLYAQLRDIVSDSNRLYNRLRNRLEDAINLARKQVRWNYKTAIPCFFPTRNVMSLMLPLCLVSEGRADAALVVELTRAGNYQGQTILTLQQAYIDARMICRPNSEWLNADQIVPDLDAYTDSDSAD